MPTDIIDIHSHILPGVDDGAEDWTECRQMLVMAHEQGIGTMIATPHFSRKQEVVYLKAQAERLSEEAKKIDPQFRIYLGQEIQYFESVVDYLKSGQALTMADSHYVLIEFMPDVSWQKLYQGVRRLRMAGYLPIIAHVERYSALRKENRLAELRAAGCYLQMNYRSIDGSLFDANMRWCRKQIQEHRIDFMGTDTHHSRHRTPKIMKSLRWLEKEAGEQELHLLTRIHAEQVLADEPI